ncbi:hypothetical protein QNH36_13785 [Mesobacillus sp. AQ2]|uniref:hypothetical protein n=1 Tax=Mesobacillus sp. AQ2 TaxID=3043332 RepID=UPI0024C1FDAB|nr:hypothetical protein [Mesobacillus sp. AQ2]WHX38763.1 hypothetical protein QNH36_13785 [Mesobacillus sp. AQ2]
MAAVGGTPQQKAEAATIGRMYWLLSANKVQIPIPKFGRRFYTVSSIGMMADRILWTEQQIGFMADRVVYVTEFSQDNSIKVIYTSLWPTGTKDGGLHIKYP